MKVVLDTSCISAFILVHKVDLLLEILKKHEVVITPQVYNELKVSKKPLLREFNDSRIAVVQAASSIAEEYNLHIGEASVIIYAKQNNALAVIDDKKARKAAEKEGIQFIGTATLLKLAIENGIVKLNEAEQLISDLTNAGKLYLSKEIRRWILS